MKSARTFGKAKQRWRVNLLSFSGITVDVWEELVITINGHADEGDGSAAGEEKEEELVQTSEESSGSGHFSGTQSKDEFSGDQVLVAFQNNHRIITLD